MKNQSMSYPAFYEILGDTFEISINFDPKTGEFWTQLPNKFCKFLTRPSKFKVEDDSIRGIKEQLKQLIQIQERKLFISNREKVIIFRPFYNGNFKYEVRQGTKDKKKKEVSINSQDLNDAAAVGVGFTFEVLYKFNYKNRIMYKTVPKGRNGISLPAKVEEGYREIPWNEKREKFFKTLESDFQLVIERLDRIFRFQKKSYLATMIDAGDINIFKKAG